MTSNPESLPDSTDLGGPCPRCGRIVAFQHIGDSPLLKLDGSERVITLKCMGCQDSIVVIERPVEVKADGQATAYEGIHWWPLRGLDDLDPDIPLQVGSTYSEGMRTLSVRAARAAAVMFRGMLAQVVADKGSAAAQANAFSV